MPSNGASDGNRPARPTSWDASTVAALDAITHKFESRGRNVSIIGLNESSAVMHDRLSGHLGAGH